MHPEDESKNVHKEVEGELDLKKFILMDNLRSQGFIMTE